MAVFLAVFVILLRRGTEPVLRTGFYLFVGIYAAQRFLWEFLKPYGTVIGPFKPVSPTVARAYRLRPHLCAPGGARSCSTVVRSSP